MQIDIINVGLSHGKSHPFSQALAYFKEMLENESHGKFFVQVFHSSKMGNEKEMQEMLTIVSLDICISRILNTCEPLFTLFEMPYLYRDRERVIKVNYGPVMQEVSATLEINGILHLGFYENGFSNISTSNKKIIVPGHLRGLKIRTPETADEIYFIEE